MTATTKPIDLDELFPKYLGSRQEKARLALLGQPGLIFKSYDMTGSYKYLNIKTKRMLSVENRGLLKIHKLSYPWIVTIHQKDKTNDEIQLHNVETEQTKRASLTLGEGETCSVLLCNSSGILIVTDKQFYFINYATFGEDKPRTIALSSTKLLERASNQFSAIEDNKALIANGWQFQLWDIETGKCLNTANLEREEDPMPFQILSLRDGVVIGSTLKKLYMWTDSGVNSIQIRDPCSCFIIDDGKLFVASITGQISVYEFPKPALVRELNVGAAAGMNFLEQMQSSRINDLIYFDEVLFAITENGDLQAWNTTQENSTAPLKTQTLKGKAKRMIKLDGKIYILVVRKGKHEELVLYNPHVKRLLAANAVSASASTPSVAAGEVRKDGYLMVKAYDSKKGKRRYVQLRDNILYEYSSPSDIAPLGTYVMSPTASIEVSASKKSKQGYVRLHLNDKQFITLSTDNAVEEDEWYKALNASIKDLKFSSFAYSVPFTSIQLVKDERGNVIKLGKGAESLVVRALLNGRDVAVKLFNQNTPSKIFKNEIEILSALRHPCIMELVGACVKQPNLALVQPLMLRGSLYDALHGAKKLDPTKYTWKLYLKIANDIASAMNYLHNFTLNNVKQPIIHRDLKPSNLLVNSLDADSNAVTVKLTDFGISAIDAKTETSSSGTTAYMAPEVQERGESVTKSDVYSFGIVLWEMLTQAVPPTVKRVANEHARSIAPNSFPEYAPAELVSLIRECTSVSPNMRPTFEGVIERLMDCTVAMISSNRINEPVTSPATANQSATSGLVIPNKLYGREPEIKSVLKAFDRFKNGAKEILFIKGYAGIGKSSFIEKMSQYASTRGYVCNGKWTQQQRRIPYFAITQALSGLLRSKAKTWTDEEKLNWKNKFLYVFEETSRRVLFELVPEARKIVHTAAETTDSLDESGSGPDMANISKDKFNYTLVTFFKMLATSEHPLIIALDDLQWADSASFDLITALFTDPSLKYLLLVGTYRDNEISSKHGLLNALQDINAAHITSVVEVRLPQLQSDSVFRMLCDTFNVKSTDKSERGELTELASIVTTKTFGNPFFIHQFLQSLFLDKLVNIDAQHRWSWNLKEIKASKATDNVSSIVTKNINGLSKKAIQLLRLASHLTSTFTSKVLAVLSVVQPESKSVSKPSSDEVKTVEEVLSEAVQKGLLFLKSKHTYKFEHDEIQQVLYGMIDKNEKQSTHYAIGRAFNKIIHSSSLAKSFPTISLFETVHQLNAGAELIKDQSEFIQLAQLNLEAAKIAIHKMIAFESAYGFLQAAMKYLDLEKGKGTNEKVHWNLNYELCFSIYFELLHCEINQGLLNDAEATIEYLFQKVDNKNKLQKARLYEMKVHLQESKYQPLEACQTALDCLNYLGILPEKTIVFALLQNPAPVFALAQQVDASKISQAELRARAARSFVQQVTPEVDLANRVLLTAMISAILSGIVPVSSLFSLLWMKLMLENPGLKVSPYALFVYSSYCINFRGDMNTAVDLTRLAYNLLQDSNDPHRAIALLNTATYLGFRMFPYKDVLVSMNKVYEMATEDGAFASVGYACIHEVYIMVMGGENVSQAIVKAEKWKVLMLAKRNFFIVFGINISLAILKLLRGDTLHNDTLTFEGFSQEETERGLTHMPPVAVFTYLVYKMFAKCLFNRWEEAYEIQKRIIAECENPIKGFLFYAFWLFLAALVPLKLYKKNVTSKTKRHEYSALFDDYMKRLKEYEMGGQNIQHWLDLLHAEELANSFYRHRKRVSVPSSTSLTSSSSSAGSPLPTNSSPSLTRKDAKTNLQEKSEKSHLKYLEATHYYNKSKEHAIKVGSLVFAGWAAEFCADFCTDLGWESMTRVYAYDAFKLYEEASASSKVEHIKSNYDDVLAEFTKIIGTTESSSAVDESSVNPHSILLLKQFGRNLMSQVRNETKNPSLRDAIDVYSDYITNMDLASLTTDSSELSSASSTISTSLETSRSTEIQVEKELASTLNMVKLIQQVSNPDVDITHSLSLLIPNNICLPLLLTPANFKEIITIYTVAFIVNFGQHPKYHLALFLEPSAELRIVFQLTDFIPKETSVPLQGETADVPVGVKNSLRPIEQLLDSVQAEFSYCRVVRDQYIQHVLKMTCAFHASDK